MKIKYCPNCGESTFTERFQGSLRTRKCLHCSTLFPRYIKIGNGYDNKTKMAKKIADKTVDTYINLSTVVQLAGGSVSLIKEYRHKPLEDFIEDVCSTNGIRFKFERQE